MLQHMQLAEWLQRNRGKRFTIAGADGVYTYTATFTSYAEANAERQKQEDIKAMFTYDEASDE